MSEEKSLRNSYGYKYRKQLLNSVFRHSYVLICSSWSCVMVTAAPLHLHTSTCYRKFTWWQVLAPSLIITRMRRHKRQQCYWQRHTQGTVTAQKSHYPPANDHASHLYKCPISRSWPPANHGYWWPNTLIIARAPARVITKVQGHQQRWLAGGYDLEIGHF